MVLSLTLPSNGLLADVSTVNTPFGQVQTAYNNHISGAADQHSSDQITEATLTEATTVINGVSNVHSRFDMVYVMLSAIMGGSGNASTRYGVLPASITGINATLTAATNVAAGTNSLVKRDAKGGTGLGASNIAAATLSVVIPDAVTSGVVIRGFAAGLFPLSIQNTAGNANVATVDILGNAVFAGILTLGSGATVLTDATGKVLSAALNTVAVLQGGTGSTTAAGARTNLGAAASGANSDITSLASLSTPLTVAQGGVGVATLAANSVLIGNGTNAVTGVAPGASGNVLASSGGAWVSTTFAAGSITNQSLPFIKMQDLAPTGTGTTLVVTVQGGTYLAVVTGSVVQRVFTTSTITLVPSGAGNMWACVYLDSTAALQVNYGAVGGSKDTAFLPSGGYAVGWFYLPTSATAVYTSQPEWVAAGSPSAKGYGIANNINGGASGSGGASGLNVNDFLVRWGTVAEAVNAVDIFTIGSSVPLVGADVRNGKDVAFWYVNPLKIAWDDPALSLANNRTNLTQLLYTAAGGLELHPRLFITFSGLVVTIAPCTIAINGVMKKMPVSTPFTVAGGTAYPWWVIADYSPALNLPAGTFTLTVQNFAPSLTSYQRLLCVAYNDGSNFLLDPAVDWSPMLDVTATQMRPIVSHFDGLTSAFSSTGNLWQKVTAATGTIKLPRSMRLVCTGYIYVSASVATTCQVEMRINGTSLGQPSQISGLTAPWGITVPVGGVNDGGAAVAGTNTIEIWIQTYGGTSTVNTASWTVTAWGT